MASRIVQYFADKLRTVKEYPITLTKAVYDENGKRLDNKLQEIDNSISDVNNSLAENVNSLNESMKMRVSRTKVTVKPSETIILNSKSIGGYYIIFSKGSAQITLGAIVGVGYGETASRHKIHVLIESDIAYRPLDDRYGLQVTNNTPHDVELIILN